MDPLQRREPTPGAQQPQEQPGILGRFFHNVMHPIAWWQGDAWTPLAARDAAAAPDCSVVPERLRLRVKLQLAAGVNHWPLTQTDLNKITTLNFSNCEITTAELQVMMPLLRMMPHLHELNLTNNRLTSLSAEIGHLAQLQTLDLGDNQLTALPPEIGRLAQLRKLDLHCNQLTALPTEIGHLAQLQNLFLGDNQLTALPPEIGRLTQLQNLFLGDNQLTALPPEIGRLAQLQYLFLANNQLTALPPEIGHLAQLQRLDLDCNRLTSLPPEIGRLAQLRELGLDDNPELREIPAALRRDGLEIIGFTPAAPELVGHEELARVMDSSQSTHADQVHAYLGNWAAKLARHYGELTQEEIKTACEEFRNICLDIQAHAANEADKKAATDALKTLDRMETTMRDFVNNRSGVGMLQALALVWKAAEDVEPPATTQNVWSTLISLLAKAANEYAPGHESCTPGTFHAVVQTLSTLKIRGIEGEFEQVLEPRKMIEFKAVKMFDEQLAKLTPSERAELDSSQNAYMDDPSKPGAKLFADYLAKFKDTFRAWYVADIGGIDATPKSVRSGLTGPFDVIKEEDFNTAYDRTALALSARELLLPAERVAQIAAEQAQEILAKKTPEERAKLERGRTETEAADAAAFGVFLSEVGEATKKRYHRSHNCEIGDTLGEKVKVTTAELNGILEKLK